MGIQVYTFDDVLTTVSQAGLVDSSWLLAVWLFAPWVIP
jgi:hypothetical protein